MSAVDNYWFAERDYSDGYDARWPWVPTLQGSTMCLSLPIRFATKQECEDFIRDEVIGAGLPDDTPPRVKSCFHPFPCPCGPGEI